MGSFSFVSCCLFCVGSFSMWLLVFGFVVEIVVCYYEFFRSYLVFILFFGVV